MNRRFSSWSKVFAFAVFASLFVILGAILVVQRYPWQTVYSDFSNGKSSRFLAHWPQSSLDEEMQERKRLKRFANSEISRRFGIQLRRMETLHYTLFDPFLDLGVAFSSSTPGLHAEPGTLFDWPSITASRRVGEPGQQKEVRYFTIPNQYGVTLKEGIILEPGEEFRFSFPVVQNRRSFDFETIPLTGGNLRCSLGQFSWSRNFSESDIHMIQNISVPVNDLTSSSLRCWSLTFKAILLNLSVGQWDKTARNPIQISQSSFLWSAQPKLIEKLVSPIQENANEQLLGEVAIESALEEKQIKDAAPEDAALVAGGEQGESSGESREGAGSEGEATVVAETEGAAAEVNDDQAMTEKKSKEEQPALVDPMNEIENKQRLVNRTKQTTALGYNVLLLQIAQFPEGILGDEKAFKNLAPNLFEIVKQSAKGKSLADTSETQEDVNFALFRKMVLSEEGHRKSNVSLAMLRDRVSRSHHFNLYSKLRNFGYKVYSSAPASFFGLSAESSFGRDVPNLQRRWFKESDWEFIQHNKDIEEKNTPLTGLDAIFQTSSMPVQTPFSENELYALGEFNAKYLKQNNTFPDWKANEIFLPDVEKLYLPSATFAFQQWLKENSQNRFFAHLVLDVSLGGTRPSLKDLVGVFRSSGHKLQLSPSRVESLAQLILLDRTVRQILEALRARKLTHRTLLAVVFPELDRTAQGGLHVWSTLHIPGVLPQKTIVSSTLDNFVGTVFSSVGIPLSNERKGAEASGVPYHPGEGWEKSAVGTASNVTRVTETNAPIVPGQPITMPLASPDNSSPQARFYKYEFFVHGKTEGCMPLSWVTSERIFGFELTQPIVEFVTENTPPTENTTPTHSTTEKFRIFPCALPGETIKMSWIQTAESAESSPHTPDGKLALGTLPATDPIVVSNFLGSRMLRNGNDIQSSLLIWGSGKSPRNDTASKNRLLPALFFGSRLVPLFSKEWNTCSTQVPENRTNPCWTSTLKGEFSNLGLVQQLVQGTLSLEATAGAMRKETNRTWLVLTRNELKF